MTIHFGDSTSIATATGLGAGILQTIQTVKTNAYSSQNTSYTDITGMSVTITPSSSSNKILVTSMINWSMVSNGYMGIRLMRGSTAIGISTALSGSNTISSFGLGTSSDSQWQYKLNTACHIFLDSPNTTNAITYKLQHKTWAETLNINKPIFTGNARYTMTGISTITAQEIKG